LILDRRIGDYILPEGWVVIAAGNRETDKAATYMMPSHIRNRFTHLEFEVHNPDWEAWAVSADVHTDILAYLKFRTEHLHKFDKEDKNDRAFATPRSWAFLSNIMKANPSPDVEFDLMAGTIGKGIGTEFHSWLKTRRKLPSIEAIIADPGKAMVPKEADMVYAISIALARAMDTKNVDAVVKYLSRVPVEYLVMAVKTATERDKALYETKAIQETFRVHYESILPSDGSDGARSKKAAKK